MRSVGNIGVNATPAYQGPSSVSASDGLSDKSSAVAAFQRTAPNAAGLSSGRGYTGLASPSLSSQTTSTLMQEQDLTQLEVQGHGGGGHGGGMKMMARNLEAEEAAGDEEAQQLRKRKKLSKPGWLEDVKQTDETDEDEETGENGKPKTSDAKRRSDASRTDENERSIWGWL